MDVSKVRLRTKKSEVNTSESASGANNKVEQEQIKKESTEKKSERAVKEEKKENLSKEKKPSSCVGIGQVTTRSRKTVAESKESDLKMSEKSVKTKKAKRKAEANSVSVKDDLAMDTDVIMKKKKKTEKKSPKCQDSQMDESKLEVTRKQTPCPKKNKKKKSPKSKPGKNNKKPDHEKTLENKHICEESAFIQEEEGKTSNEPCSEQQPIAPDNGENQTMSGMSLQDQELRSEQHVAKKDKDSEVKDQEIPKAEEEIAKTVSQNKVGIELAIIPGTSSEDSNTTSEKETKVRKDTLSDLVQEIPTIQTCKMEMATNPDLVQVTEPMQISEKETATNPHPEGDSSVKKLQAKDPTGTPAPQLTGKVGQSMKMDLVSAASRGAVVNENQEMEEDEGIHSHDGSDISDNISEGSDDSGLNGARSVQEEATQKAPQEVPEAKATKENYVCIFCDRSFKKEGEYSKHLNRHLVNVYYLEKATKGQD